MMGWSTTPTSSSGSEVVVYVVVRTGGSSFTASTADVDTSVLLVRGECPGGNRYSVPLPKVLSLEENRNLAAARAHAHLMADSVRAAPPRAPRATRERHGHYGGPRFSAHTSTRTR